MKHSTRNLVVAAAARKLNGDSVEELYDCTHQTYVPMRGVDAHDAPLTEDDRLLLEISEEERVSVKFENDLFLGWDLNSGFYFAGAIHESDVLLFDAQERRYFHYQLH
ncbi:MAG: hypothetical protein KIS79_02710 [Burkholderiales bacterium]|nr:hypothetical protein [Burkholderiales bacterium]